MKKIVLFLFLYPAVYLTGCNKQLDKLPDNRTIISTTDQVTQLLTSAYPHATYMAFCEPMSDNSEDKGAPPQPADPESYQINSQAYKFQDVTSIRFDSPIAYWDSCYKAIAAANLVLFYCNGKDSASYSAQKGEALVCRAYAHFMLSCFFAKPYDPATAASDPGIPYITQPQHSVFDSYKRGTVQSVYDHIENDLKLGLSLIQEKIYGSAIKFHFSLQATHAFAARFYLFKRDYAQVINHASAVFGNTEPSTLLRDQVKNYGTLQYQEVQLKYISSAEPANILLQEARSDHFENCYKHRYGISEVLRNVIMDNSNVTGGKYAIITYGSTPQFYNYPKWNPYNVGPETDNIKYGLAPLFSMEEVLMNRAEANVRLQHTTAAIADLNAWISKNVKAYNPLNHNLTPDRAADFYHVSADSALIQAALDFKRVTYLQEGIRWLDNIRLGMPIRRFAANDLSTVTDSVPANDKRRVLQLPAEAIAAGLEPNPR